MLEAGSARDCQGRHITERLLRTKIQMNRGHTREKAVNESRLLTSGALPMQEPQASQPSHLRRDGPREGWGW